VLQNGIDFRGCVRIGVDRADEIVKRASEGAVAGRDSAVGPPDRIGIFGGFFRPAISGLPGSSGRTGPFASEP